MKKLRLDINKDTERNAKRYLVKIMLAFLRPLQQKEQYRGKLRSVVILAQEKLGDAILLTPLLKNLKRFFPEAEIHVVALSPVFFFFEKDPHVDVVYRVKQDYLSYFWTIRKKKFDLLFSPKDHFSFTFLYQSRLISAKYRVGIDHVYHSGFFNHMIHLDFHKHVIEKNCALLEFLGISYSPKDCRPYLPQESVSLQVTEFCKALKGRKAIGINLSAGESDREWSLEKWTNFLAQIKQPVIIFSMPSRHHDKDILEKRFKHVIRSPETRSIYEAGQIIKYLSVLISPDTSLVHVASCYNISVVGLYRNITIHLDRFYPYLVEKKLLISPTHRIEDIPVDQVVHAMKELLDSTQINV